MGLNWILFILLTSWFYVISDSEHYKSQALRNAKEAYQIHQQRVSCCMHTLPRHTQPCLHCANLQISPCRRKCLTRMLRTVAVRRSTQLVAHPQALGSERATAFPTHPSMQVKTFLSPPSSMANSRVTNSRAWTGWPTSMNRYPRLSLTLETCLDLQGGFLCLGFMAIFSVVFSVLSVGIMFEI